MPSTACRRPPSRGKSASEDLRLAPPLDGDGAVAWYRIRVRPLEGAQRAHAAVWTVSDETREHDRHENCLPGPATRDRLLDHAPAGFFSAEPDGAIVLYERDARGLARLRSRPGRLRRPRSSAIFVAGDGAALLAASPAGRAK